MIQPYQIDLTGAISSQIPEVREIGSAAWVYFLEVPSDFYVRLNDGPRIPITAPIGFRHCGGQYTRIAIDNDNAAGVGTLVVLVGDSSEEPFDPKADAGEAGALSLRSEISLGDAAGEYWDAQNPTVNVSVVAGASVSMTISRLDGVNAPLLNVSNIGINQAGGVSFDRHSQQLANLMMTPPANVAADYGGRIVVRDLVRAYVGAALTDDARVYWGLIANKLNTHRGAQAGISFVTKRTGNSLGTWFARIGHHSTDVLDEGVIYELDSGVTAVGEWHVLEIELNADDGVIIWRIDGTEITRFSTPIAEDIYAGQTVAVAGNGLQPGAYAWKNQATAAAVDGPGLYWLAPYRILAT